MVDAFYRDQSLWVSMDEKDFSAWLLDTILALGLDRTVFETAMADTNIRDQLLLQLDDALQAGITYTPYLLINGEVYPEVPRDLNTMRSMTELALLQTHLLSECPPPMLAEGASYTATLHTEKGDVVIQLFPEVAPQAVNNFIFLTQQGWYEDIPFYRVIPGSYALSGDPSGTGLGNPGYTFNAEINPLLQFDRPGVLAMNNTGAPDTNGSNFFITFQAMPSLDGAFTIFGQVVEGMEVLRSLTPRDPASDTEFIPADRLLSVTIQQQ
jgi:cyclophilin family peptidyl-prolyl cis-trans isomerase